ncbi:MAG: hypothetical protein IJY42_05515 [Clostridia bacterium]|nr:hypothetical protein [Clostridia bacterium]
MGNKASGKAFRENLQIPSKRSETAERSRSLVLQDPTTVSGERGREDKRQFESKQIGCPFFKSQRERSICCEGVERNSHLELSFRRADQKKRYTSTYCAKNFRSCLIARMNDLKYDDTGNWK